MIYHVDGSARNSHMARISIYRKGFSDIIFLPELDGPSSGVIEYHALIYALEICKWHDTIKSDSKSVVNQVNGRARVRSPKIKALCARARKLRREKEARVLWLPRERNMAGIFLEQFTPALGDMHEFFATGDPLYNLVRVTREGIVLRGAFPNIRKAQNLEVTL